MQPGMSMAAVAMAHGVNANLLRRWVRDAEMNSATTVVSATTAETPKAQEAKTVFVPVSFQAMKHCGHAVPTISEDVQETCLQRLTATMQFTEGVPPDLVAQMITKSCVDHPERYLLAFVYGHLGQHDLLRVRTDAEKFLLLAALNLVECITYVGAQLQSK
jgi:transposase-like protein